MSWVTFECRADPGLEVFLGGTFNRWKPSRLDRLRDKRHDGTYRTLINLHPGHTNTTFWWTACGGWIRGTPATSTRT
jgi:hypothetical protein